MDLAVVTSRARHPALAWGAALLAAGVLLAWLYAPVRAPLVARVPGTDRPETERATGETGGDVFAQGLLVAGTGRATDLPGSWPWFRGASRDGMGGAEERLARSWPGGKPKELWSIEVGEGYAGPAVMKGRIYLMDYDRAKQRDALRCLSLADGTEIWRYTYPVSVKRNHWLTRTVPAVKDAWVVAMGPKCHVATVHAETGRFQWGIDLVKDYGTTVPAWYTGQCPLVDGDLVILAPSGPETQLLAVELATGKVRWKTPNPSGWKMTHSSVMPLEVGGQRYYLYCGSGGVVAVSAVDGAIAWETAAWKINIATVPSPVVLEGGRVFFSGGYGAGSAMYAFSAEGSALKGTEVFRLKADVFGATQHSPIWHGGHLYGIRADGRLVCLSPDGKVVWASGADAQFGLGPMMIADGMILAMDDSAKLTLAEAGTGGYRPVATAALFEGTEAWAPFALAGGRLLARDMTRMVCLQVGP